MTNETIRIYAASGFVFDLSYDWVVTHMKEHQFMHSSERTNMNKKLDVLEYVKKLSWPELSVELKFVGVVEDSSQDTLHESIIDLVNNPLNYKITKQKKMQFKLTKL